MTEINNIDEAMDEKVRILQMLDKFAPVDDIGVETFLTIARTSLMWVTKEMSELTLEAALTLPEDYEPRDSDFGMLPDLLFVCFAGDAMLENVWVYMRDNENGITFESWESGFGGALSEGREWKSGDKIGGQDDIWRKAWAFILLVNQKLVRHMAERPSRAARRRSGLPPDETVIVVTLRRLKRQDEDEGQGDIEYSHRWLVQGHWRNQWYPSEQRHVPKFIATYVKGPEDKPLVIKDRIFRVSR